MNEIDRLKAWMKSRDFTTKQLAHEMGIPYITAYMSIAKRERLSANFELRFRHCFGADVANQIFDTPALPERETA